MATDKITSVEDFLKSIVPMNDIPAQARVLGAVQRYRAVDVAQLLIVVVVLGCGLGEQSLAATRRALSLKPGVSLPRSSFGDRFTPGFEALVDWLLERLRPDSRESPPIYAGLLSGLKEAQAVDATVIEVDKSLRGV
jgi:hypothetical protein